MPEPFALIVVAAFGLAAGSFLNVCIYRLPRRQAVVRPPSHCPACGTRLRWADNIPVVSYLWLRGRCRACGTPITVTYPLVEIATAVLFVLHFWQLGPDPLLVPRLLLACALVVLFVTDLEHHLLPNSVTLPGIIMGLVFSIFLPPGWLTALIGTVAGGAMLLALAEGYYRLRGEEGLGMGDVKMLAMIGAFLGWQLVLVTLVLASLLGSIVGTALIITGRGGMKSALPFGSFLALGALAASLYGETLLGWYLGFY